MKNFVITFRFPSDDLFLRREVNAGSIASFRSKYPDAQIIERFEGLLLSAEFVWDAALGERADAFCSKARELLTVN